MRSFLALTYFTNGPFTPSYNLYTRITFIINLVHFHNRHMTNIGLKVVMSFNHVSAKVIVIIFIFSTRSQSRLTMILTINKLRLLWSISSSFGHVFGDNDIKIHLSTCLEPTSVVHHHNKNHTCPDNEPHLLVWNTLTNEFWCHYCRKPISNIWYATSCQIRALIR